jgi:hypothetical protein
MGYADATASKARRSERCQLSHVRQDVHPGTSHAVEPDVPLGGCGYLMNDQRAPIGGPEGKIRRFF